MVFRDDKIHKVSSLGFLQGDAVISQTGPVHVGDLEIKITVTDNKGRAVDKTVITNVVCQS
jgi:hypothetical protein